MFVRIICFLYLWISQPKDKVGVKFHRRHCENKIIPRNDCYDDLLTAPLQAQFARLTETIDGLQQDLAFMMGLHIIDSDILDSDIVETEMGKSWRVSAQTAADNEIIFYDYEEIIEQPNIMARQSTPHFLRLSA